MRKPKTMKEKIMHPYIGMIIILPLIIFLIFNLTMQVYILKSAENEIKTTFETMNLLLRNTLTERNLDIRRDSNQEAISETINALNTAFKVSRITGNAEMFIVTKDKTVIFPRNTQNTLLTEQLAEEIEGIIPTKSAMEPIKVDLGTQSYLVGFTAMPTTRRLNNSPTHFVVLIASLNSADLFIQRINLILFAIVSVTVMIGSVVAKKVSNSISKPIMVATKHADQIAKGHYYHIEPDNSSEEINQFYRSMNRMSQMLEHNEKSQQAFLQNISHDLRTPLMSIQGYAEGIASGVFKDPIQPSEIIATESIRLTQMVEELLTLSRLESSGMNPDMVIVDAEEVLSELIGRSKGLAMKKNKEVNLMCPSKCTLRIDRNLFEKAVFNLIDNGLKYAEKTVTIEIRVEFDTCKVLIMDDGKGIHPDDLPHVFKRFYKGKSGNHGLGLAIVKRAMDLMNASIKAYNQDSGAVFELIFPNQ